jgi:CHAD domain-containing protein
VIASQKRGKQAVASEALLARQHERVTDVAGRTGIDAPPPELHRVRKRAKELRYLLELFSGDEIAEHRREMRKQLKKMQDALGEVQDAAVQHEWLTGHAGEVGPIDVRLKELDERSAVARGVYGERLARFLTIDL